MWEPYVLGLKTLKAETDAMSEALAAGLAADGQEIAALPAWLPRPSAAPEGAACVLDLGGSNIRAARLELRPGGRTSCSKVLTGRVLARDGATMGSEEFFLQQAALLLPLLSAGDPLGYCFSYPSRSLPDGGARLLRWTKEVNVPDVAGRDVGELLTAALRGLGAQPGPCRVINDTVAVLMAGVLDPGAAGADCAAGLIVGTGTNMASFFSRDLIPKLGGGEGGMAVNLESGNYCPRFTLSQADDLLDAASQDPGRQRFEKAVSGAYLAAIVKQELPEAPLDPRAGSVGLVALLERGDVAARTRQLARVVLERSADLIAAGLAALAQTALPGGGLMFVAAEGGLIRGVPFYTGRLEATFAALCRDVWRLRLAMPEDANLRGSAVSARLVPGSSRAR